MQKIAAEEPQGPQPPAEVRAPSGTPAETVKPKRGRKVGRPGSAPAEAAEDHGMSIGRKLKNWGVDSARGLDKKVMEIAGKTGVTSNAAKRAIGYGVPGALLAGGGITAAALMSKKKEKTSHLQYVEDAAVARANELLKLSNQGHEITFNKVASLSDDSFDRLITERAWALLEEEGYIE